MFLWYSDIHITKFKLTTSVALYVSIKSAELLTGETVSLAATVTPTDAFDKSVVWSSSNSSVATVKNGLVTAKKDGTTTITVKYGGNEVKVHVTVTKKNKPEKPGKPDKPSKPEKPGKPDKPGKPGKPGKPDKPGKPEQPGKPDNPGKPEQPGKPGNPGKQ